MSPVRVTRAVRCHVMARGYTYPDDLGDRLVSAAAERLLVSTPDQLNLRELAASQETSTNAIYTIFGGKQALIAEVIARANETFLARQDVAREAGPTVEGLVRLGAEYRAWALEHPALYMLMFGNCGASSAAVPVTGAVEPLIEMVTGLVRAGILRDLPIETICRVFWAATHGFVMIEMTEQSDPDEGAARYDAFQHIILRGLLTDEALARLESAE